MYKLTMYIQDSILFIRTVHLDSAGDEKHLFIPKTSTVEPMNQSNVCAMYALVYFLTIVTVWLPVTGNPPWAFCIIKQPVRNPHCIS